MNPLQQHMKRKNRKLSELAARLGKSVSTASRIVAGQARVDRDDLRAVYDLTGITPNDYFNIPEKK